MKFDCENCEQNPSLIQTPNCMEDAINQLEKHAKIDKILLDGKYVQEYKEEDLAPLKEFIRALEDSRYLILKALTPEECTDCEEKRKSKINEIWSKFKREPRKGKAELEQLKKELEDRSQRGPKKCKLCREHFLNSGIKPALNILTNTELLDELEPEKEDRSSYEKIFSPKIRPSFLRSKIELKPPGEAELVDAYENDGAKTRIYHSPKKLEHLYFLIPPEYELPPKQVNVLQKVREKLLKEHGNLDPTLARKEIEKRSRRLIMDTALEDETRLDEEEIEKLAKSLAKFTAGLGIIETLLADPKIQDIYIDAPVGENPVHIYHQDFEECLTNVFLTPEDAQVLTSRFRAISGRPFSEANPTLDLNLENVRVAAIQKPLSPEGLAFAIRRHKSTPWTLPLFIKKDFLTPKAAGLLSLLVDSQASILITGSRGAGKTSLLGALLLELLPKYRILCLEDTAELPIKTLRSLGYKAQRLQVQSAGSDSKIEMSAEEALRSALRLGESVLVLGEVRGSETKSLYEAMRVGAAGNSVMGTIHGSTTEDVYERVVYDLEIPPSSFKATDAIAVAAPIREKGSINRIRRLTQISEVGEDWKEDAIEEDGFTDLMSYEPKDDRLEARPALEKSESVLLKTIAKKWSMKIQEVKKNLGVRSKIHETLTKAASSAEKPELLEASAVVKSNLAFHRFLEEEFQENQVNYNRLYSRWEDWLKEDFL